MAITNLIVPAGKIYFDPKDATTGLLTGERYFGDTPGCTIGMTSKTLDVWGSDGAISEIEDSIPISVLREFKFKARSITDFNLALFTVSTSAAFAQSSGTVTDESIAGVQQDRYYQIGKSTANPTGVRGISAVTVKVAAVTKTVNTDYTVDLVLGRVYIVTGGGIANNDTILVTYTKAANSRIQHTAANTNTIQYGALRFVADNTLGINRDIYLPTVSVVSDGDAEIKRSADDAKVLEMGFIVKGLKPATGASMYIDGRAA